MTRGRPAQVAHFLQNANRGMPLTHMSLQNDSLMDLWTGHDLVSRLTVQLIGQ